MSRTDKPFGAVPLPASDPLTDSMIARMKPVSAVGAGVIPEGKALRARTPGTYVVNEVFYSVQGEGSMTGTPMVFVRFADCNLRCSVASTGFDCDTEFASGREMTPTEVEAEIGFAIGRATTSDHLVWRYLPWLLFTGGEPGLQLDGALIDHMKRVGFRLAVETNGTVRLPEGIDHICVSPKSAEHTIRQRWATDVKYVRSAGQAIPETVVEAQHRYISPAFQPDGTVRREDLEWCIRLCLENPAWSLSVQTHKLLGVR